MTKDFSPTVLQTNPRELVNPDFTVVTTPSVLPTEPR